VNVGNKCQGKDLPLCFRCTPKEDINREVNGRNDVLDYNMVQSGMVMTKGSEINEMASRKNEVVFL